MRAQGKNRPLVPRATRGVRTDPKPRRRAMIRKLILSAVLSAAALTELTTTPGAADANPPVGQHHRGRFEVQVLRRHHWDCYGTYRDRDDARRAAQRLRHQGFQVRIERD